MASETLQALWVAPFEATLPDGTSLIPGETTVEISAGEAKDSDNWRPVRSKKSDGGDS